MENNKPNNTIDGFYVFLDTEVFVANNFDFSNTIFKQIKSLVSDKKIILLTTPITENEILNNIQESISKSKTAFKKFKNEGKLLRFSYSTPFHLLWDKFDFNEICKEIIGQFNQYCKETKIKRISLEGISIEKVFSDYFNIQPPFNEGNKKYEFPDAFAIAALELWSIENKKLIYVISNDDDWKKACELKKGSFIFFKKTEELLEKIVFYYEISVEQSETIFLNHLDEIIDNITGSFEDLGFYIDPWNIDIPIDDEHVEKIEVQEVRLVEKFLISAGLENLLFKCTFKVDFSAEIFYIDNSEAAYDSETGSFHFGEDIHKTIPCSSIVPIEINISYDVDDNESESEIIEQKYLINDISIELFDDGGYPYK